MGETRAYLTAESDDTARVDVYDDVTLYGGRHGKDPVFSGTFPLTDDGVDYVMGAEPGQPYADADGLLSANGFRRDGVWLSGDVITGTFARVSRV